MTPSGRPAAGPPAPDDTHEEEALLVYAARRVREAGAGADPDHLDLDAALLLLAHRRPGRWPLDPREAAAVRRRLRAAANLNPEGFSS